MNWTPEEVKILVAFHKQHGTAEKIQVCEWCYKAVDGELNEVPISPDGEEGEYVCDTCMVKYGVLHEEVSA